MNKAMLSKLTPVLLVLATGVACEPLEEAFINQPIDPTCQGANAQVSGTWQITGTGERTDCDDSTFDASFFELSSLPLPIVQSGDTLELVVDGLPSTFTLTDGLVNGRCVEFRTVETTEDLGVIQYEWLGTVSESGQTVTGEFSGSGPAGCRVRGNFRFDVPIDSD